MIDAVGSGTSMPQMVARAGQGLSSEQEQLITDTLAQYDAENLSAEDAASIIETFEEAGIQPGRALEAALADEGFDAKEIGDLAQVEGPQGAGGPNGPPPPPPSGETEEDIETIEASSIMDYLETLLAEQEEDVASLTDADKQGIYSQVLEHFGLTAGESLVNIQV